MKNLKQEIRLTDHFVERYFERVLNQLPPIMSDNNKGKQIKKVMNDLESRISQRDKHNLLFLKNSREVRVPFEKKQIVMSNGVFITVLS